MKNSQMCLLQGERCWSACSILKLPRWYERCLWAVGTHRARATSDGDKVVPCNGAGQEHLPSPLPNHPGRTGKQSLPPAD